MEEIVTGIFVEDRYRPYNVGLVMLDEGALVVDVPPRPAEARQWLREAQQTAGMIRYIVLTDSQPERLIGAAHWNVPIIAGERTARLLTDLVHEDADWNEILEDFGTRYPDIADDLTMLKPRRALLACTRHLLLHHTQPPLEVEVACGAAPGSIWLYVPEQKVLFAGDAVAFDTPPVLSETLDSKAWLSALGSLAHRKTVHRIVPGRGAKEMLRGELEPQREFMRVARRTARKLARKTEPGSGLAQATNELQQAFFPSFKKDSQPILRIRAGLEHLVNEILEEERQTTEESV
jgi:glyoxylase-like metal-dependent hydrolase (beta-lactamase superfamily II)